MIAEDPVLIKQKEQAETIDSNYAKNVIIKYIGGNYLENIHKSTKLTLHEKNKYHK